MMKKVLWLQTVFLGKIFFGEEKKFGAFYTQKVTYSQKCETNGLTGGLTTIRLKLLSAAFLCHRFV